MSNKKELIIGIVAAVAAAIFSNIDRVVPVIEDLVASKEEISLEGSWIGVFRDVAESLKEETYASVFIDIEQSGTEFIGRVKGSSNSLREWKLEGKIHSEWVDTKGEGPFLFLKYVSQFESNTPASEIRASFGVYVLEPVTHPLPSGISEYQGYWFGHEPDANKIMACPLILSNDKSEAGVKERNRNWLTQRCAYRTDQFPGNEKITPHNKANAADR